MDLKVKFFLASLINLLNRATSPNSGIPKMVYIHNLYYLYKISSKSKNRTKFKYECGISNYGISN